jgi:hypothetical protein
MFSQESNLPNFEIQRFSLDEVANWFEKQSKISDLTLYQNPAFLKYHLKKFNNNEHHLVFRYKGKIIGYILLALFETKEGNKIAKSPYGGSFGGAIFLKNTGIHKIIECVKILNSYLIEIDVNEIIITTSPALYTNDSNSFYQFALQINGFNLEYKELLHFVDLQKIDISNILSSFDEPCRNKTRRSLEKFKIRFNLPPEEFYPILMDNKKKHNSIPTHTLDELMLLKDMFPTLVRFDIAYDMDKAVAGICYFTINERCISTFYMAQLNDAIGTNPLNALIYNGLKKAIEDNFKIFDFGGSSLHGAINHFGVANFKESFGAVGALKETFVKVIK